MNDLYQSTIGDTGGAVNGRGMIELDGNKLKAPDNIIMSVQAARSYYNNYRQSHVHRIQLFAAIQGVIAGNPPYDSEKLAAAGLSYIANVNTLDAKGLFEKAALTFWNLVNQTENIVAFSLRPFQLTTGQDHEFDTWAEILSRNWTKVIKENWEDFITEMNMLTGQLVMLGVSPVVWSDEEDFRWTTVDLSRFFVADQAPVAVSKWDCICFESTYTMQYLFSVYETLKDVEPDKDGKTPGPWNKHALEQYILWRANKAHKPQHGEWSNYLELNTAIQNGSFNHGNMFTDSVRLVSLLYKEYSGKVSHYIFDGTGQNGNEEFLFQVSEQYESFTEALVLFTYSPGERLIHSNRGVGHKIFPLCQALMQLDCTMLDMAKMSATPIVKTMSGTGKEFDPIRIIPGVITNIGQSELQPNQLGSNLGGLVSVANYMDQKVNKNAIMGGDDPSRPDADRGSKSAPEVQLQSIKEFGVGKNNVAHFYNKLDVVFRNMVAKMLHCKETHPGYDIVKEWKERCIDEGVPEEIFDVKDASRNKLPRHLSVRAARAGGDGSHAGLIMGLKSVGAIAGGFSAKGQYNYKKDIITSGLGMDYVDRYLAGSEVPDEGGAGASLATVENFMIQQGQSPQATQDNQHKAHIASHMAVVSQTIQAVQAQKMDPIAADKIFAMALQHLGDHINFLTPDPLNRAFLEQIQGPWRQINKFAQLNRVKAQKMMQTEIRRRAEEEEQMTADMMEQNRKDMIAERDEKRKDFKVMSQVERAKEANKTRGEIMRDANRMKADNEREANRMKAENERIKNSQVRKPEQILEGETTEELQNTLESQVGRTPNPADFA